MTTPMFVHLGVKEHPFTLHLHAFVRCWTICWNIEECGFSKVLQPLLYDLQLFEQSGVYLEQLGASVKEKKLLKTSLQSARWYIDGQLFSQTVRKKRGLTSQLLAPLLCQTKTTEPTDVRCLCIRGLPVILGDDPSAFFKTSFDPVDKDLYSQTAVGILCIDEENSQMNPARVGIILEGNMVMDDLANLPQAFCVPFGLIYALHLEYHEYMKNTFFFVQQVMLDLGKSELAPKIQTLKNQLSM
ncbi:uncharacterized protein LOC124860838 isoform X3 [Girardinichthys multiradiatus]|uniref:uncharacterized protein LOC124860838 isoform X3 n=1 Tax=Girardinichthys multiradiatus TaxID=208333 RepID=UPI001FAC0FEE|nr:uncharacterized protein LOC124860838 isoform X3 [Girardinichthys multiradiatus]